MRELIVLDSVTLLAASSAGHVVVAGSHCGVYAAYLAARAHARAVVLNDAGVGKDGAGIAGLGYLDKLQVPAAAIDHDSARIGDGSDCLRRGVIRHVNHAAADLGCAIGQTTVIATRVLNERTPDVRCEPPAAIEGRHRLAGPWSNEVMVWTLDSISLVGPAVVGAIVVAGSHGGLLGGRPETALKHNAFAALYNDAGGGIDDAGFSRLPALDKRGIAAATVDAFSARIGDGRSTYDEGIISRANRTAIDYGVGVGMSARTFVARMAEAIDRRRQS